MTWLVVKGLDLLVAWAAPDKGKVFHLDHFEERAGPRLALVSRVSYRFRVRWLLTWMVCLGIWGCGAAQYSARAEAASAGGDYDYSEAAPPPMVPAAPPAPISKVDDGSKGALDLDPQYGNEFAAPGTYQPSDESVGTVGTESAPDASQPTPPRLPRQLMLIYRGELVLAVFQTKATLDKIEQLAQQFGGYLVQRSDDIIVIRVPVAKFESGLKDAAALGDEVSRQVNVEDVSEQYHDIRIRLKNAEAVRERLASLLAQAQNVSEALQVEAELARVTMSIELMKGKLKLFDELIAFSTITVRVQQQSTQEHLTPRVTLPFPWLQELGLSNLLNLEAE